MFDEIKNIKEDNSNCKSKKGFQITVKNLDTGETIFDSKTNAIIGAYAVGAEGGAIATSGIIVASCNTPTLMATIDATDKVSAEAKKKVIDGMPPEVLLAALMSDKLK